MKEILFATGNASKVARFYEKLLEKGILLKSLKDIDIRDRRKRENSNRKCQNKSKSIL